VTLVLGARLCGRSAGDVPSANPLRRSLLRRERVPNEAAAVPLAAADKGFC
jgi:hypothetical protein